MYSRRRGYYGDWRVIEITNDPFGLGIPFTTVIADGLTRSEAKHIYRYFEKKYWYDDEVDVRIEVFFDGGYQDVTQTWINVELEEQELWFDRMGFDYNWWLEFGEIKKLG